MAFYNSMYTKTSIPNDPLVVSATVVEPSAPPRSSTATLAYQTAQAPSAVNFSRHVSPPLNSKQLETLTKQGFTPSLAASLDDVKKNFPLRIWVVDNSGSMFLNDGHRIVDRVDQSSVRMVPCTRWAEISACVEYHMRLAALIEAPTRFRLLNPPANAPAVFSISEQTSYSESNSRYLEVEGAVDQFRRVKPSGVTPLTRHVHEIRAEIAAMAPELRRTGQRVCVVLATDGLPTDETGQSSDLHQHRFVEALRNLEGLPVWVVIRLCTDEDEVVSFWNDIDSILELDIDVLDDFTAEAKEIEEFNPWLNYALPLHRLREFGNHDRLYDLIDERPFTKSEIRDFCAIVFGQDRMDGVPDPNLDWDSFVKHVARMAESTNKVWNPLYRRPKKWISPNKLRWGLRSGFRLCG